MTILKSNDKTNHWVWILLVLNFAYLFFELIFNTTLLNTASSVDINEDTLRSVELFGRSVSGAGFALFMLGVIRWIGFKQLTNAQRLIAVVPVFIACLIPFYFNLSGSYGLLAIVSLIAGGFAVHSSYNNYEIRTAISTVIFAWITMFAGQKILVEHFLIEPSSVETRATAQYMTLLKAGIVKDFVVIEGAPFDTASMNEPEERTFITLLGALVMRTTAFLDLVKSQEENIINRINEVVAQDKLQQNYANYRAKGEDFQSNWLKYSSGSQSYNEAMQGAQTKGKDEYASLLNRLGQGFDEYRKGVDSFAQQMRPKAERLSPELTNYFNGRSGCQTLYSRQSFGSQYDNTVKWCTDNYDRDYYVHSKSYFGKEIPWTFWCDKREAHTAESVVDGAKSILNAPFAFLQKLAGNEDKSSHTTERYTCDTSVKNLMPKLMVLYENEFIRHSGGYPLGISTSNAFINHSATLKRIRDETQHKGLPLPRDWKVTNSNEYIAAVKSKVESEIKQQWTKSITATAGGFIPTSLTYNEFVQQNVIQQKIKASMGDAYIPGMTFEFSEREFMDRIIKPEISRQIKQSLNQLRNESMEFANGKPREEEGKKYLRAVLIPPISLFLSLFFAFITAGKTVVAVVSMGLQRIAPSSLKLVQSGLWLLLIGVAFEAPFHVSNKFSDSRAFKYFADQTIATDPVLTMMCKWTIRMQPVMYPVGNKLLTSFGGIFPDHEIKKESKQN